MGFPRQEYWSVYIKKYIYIPFQIPFHHHHYRKLRIVLVLYRKTLLFIYFRNSSVYLLNPKLLIYPPHSHLFGNGKFVLYLWIYFCFINKFIYLFFLRLHIKIIYGICLSPTDLLCITSRSIRVATNDIISLFFCGWVISWERSKVGGEGDDRGWDGWMASLTWWTWVWVSSRSWWWTGKSGLLQSMGSQRVGHDWVTELN